MEKDSFALHMLSTHCIVIPRHFGDTTDNNKIKFSKNIGYSKSSKYKDSYIGFGFSKDLGTDVAIASLLLF